MSDWIGIRGWSLIRTTLCGAQYGEPIGSRSVPAAMRDAGIHRQRISATIACEDGVHEVPGWMIDVPGLAATDLATSDEVRRLHRRDDRWSVTHLRSGMRLGVRRSSLGLCLLAVDALRQWDWTGAQAPRAKGLRASVALILADCGLLDREEAEFACVTAEGAEAKGGGLV